MTPFPVKAALAEALGVSLQSQQGGRGIQGLPQPNAALDVCSHAQAQVEPRCFPYADWERTWLVEAPRSWALPPTVQGGCYG